MININIKGGKVVAKENTAKKISSKNKIDILPESKAPVIHHKVLPKTSNGHPHEVKIDLNNSSVQTEKGSKLPIKLNGINNSLTTISRVCRPEKTKPLCIAHGEEIPKAKPTNRNFNHLSCYDQGAPPPILSGQDYRNALMNNFAANVVCYGLMLFYIMADLAELYLFSALQNPEKLNTFFPGYKEGEYWHSSNSKLKTDEPYGSDNLIKTHWKGSCNYPALHPIEIQKVRCKLVAAYARINSIDFNTAVNTLLERFDIDPQNV